MKSKVNLNGLGFREDYDDKNRFHIETIIDNYLISTIYLGIDYNRHRIFGKNPLYYETVIFDYYDSDDEFFYIERYTTKEQAVKGHKLTIQYVLNLIYDENKRKEIKNA